MAQGLAQVDELDADDVIRLIRPGVTTDGVEHVAGTAE
jgi:hypothetical protein